MTSAGAPDRKIVRAGGHARFSWLVWAGTLAIATALWAAAILLARYDEGEAMARAERDTGNLARVVAEQTTRTLAEADQLLLLMAESLRDTPDPDPGLLHRQMRNAVKRSGILVQLALIDERGFLAVTSVENAPARVSLADRDHFRVHAETAGIGLFISKPVFGRASGKWSIQLTRRVERTDGSFGGVLVASLDPSYFSRSLNDLHIGKDGVFSIVGTDGVLRARSIIDDRTIGMDLGSTSTLLTARKQQSGFLHITSAVDGVVRLQSFRVLDGYPLLVIAAVGEEAFLTDTRHRQKVYYAVAAASAFALICLALLATRQSGRLAAAAARLSESETRFRDLAETASDWFWETDAEHRIASLLGPLVPELANGGLPFGMRQEELAVREPGDEARWDDYRRILERREAFRNFRCQVQTRRGLRCFSVSGRPVFSDTGKFIGYRGCAADITERELAFQRQQSNEARYRAMFAAVGQPLLTIDGAGTIENVNAAAVHLFGYEEGELPGRDVGILMPAGQAAVHGAHLRSYAESGRPHPVSGARELVGRRKDGSEFPLEVTLANWRDGDRQYFTGALRDITAQREFEDSLRRARDEADRASRIKGEFLATMSHEIRTPMNGVLGALALVEGPNLTGEQLQMLEIARKSGTALLQIIDDILDLSKLEAGRVEIEPVDCDLRAVVRDAIDLLQPVAAGRGLSLVLSVAPSVPELVSVDIRRVRQVLVNLVGNAIKFTNRGGVTVRVALQGKPAEDGSFLVEAEVEDSGIGIPADIIPTLFRRFTQADSSTTRRFGGTGLGLAISRELVDLMEGTIGVESVEGRGSRFWFTARCRPPTGDAASVHPHSNLTLDRTLTILVAEDNEVNREIVAAMLNRAGHRVVTVHDGVEAVQAVREARFDAVLMDVQMPMMDGITATRHIRAMPPPIGRIPIVALTGNAMPGSREEYLAAGMTAYLTKPIVSATLFATLASVTGGARSAAVAELPALAMPEDWRSGRLIDEEQSNSVRDAVGEEIWATTVAAFNRTTRQSVASLRQFADPGDPEAVRLAHTLKGTAANMGAERLSRLAALIEKEKDTDIWTAAVAQLDGVLDDTLAALTAEIAA